MGFQTLLVTRAFVKIYRGPLGRSAAAQEHCRQGNACSSPAGSPGQACEKGRGRVLDARGRLSAKAAPHTTSLCTRADHDGPRLPSEKGKPKIG